MLHVIEFRYTVCGQRWGRWVSSMVTAPGAKKGVLMEFLVVAIIVLAGVGLFRFWRTRTAH
jgi:hypothetical protein